jgi:uncharacterized protein
MDVITTYFENRGKENTDAVLDIAKRRAVELGIKTILVASTTGWTAVKAVEALKNFRLIVVTHSVGFTQPNIQDFTDENRRIVESKGATIFTATHVFGGISRAMSITQPPATYTTTYVPGDIVLSTLGIFGMGLEVACEIATMAADAGLVRTDEDIISIAGTTAAGRGADTAIVIRPSNAHQFFRTRVKEILCKPRLDSAKAKTAN